MRLEVKAAFAVGILLPVLETCRRGVSEWGVDFTTMFTDYLAGALLLIGAWAAYKFRSWGSAIPRRRVGLGDKLDERQSLGPGRSDPPEYEH